VETSFFELFSIFICSGFIVVVAFFLFVLSFWFTVQSIDLEKSSTYECGFDPFNDARVQFDVKFYLVAILFIIFDLEITFLFPWVLSLSVAGELGYFNVFLFLFILTVGFVYEWCKGALEW
jgi:NADH-quinone oxidoreductase subunit A